MNCRLVVCADDLTGACECAASLAASGVSASLVADHRQLQAKDFNDTTALAVNTRSRHAMAKEAAARVRRVARLAAQTGVERFYKKTDSASRGHLGAELSAALAFLAEDEPPQPIAFLPAAPAAGRAVIDGQLLIHGQPAHLSGFAQDPDDPVTESDLRRLLSRETDLPTRLLSPSAPPPQILPGREILLFGGSEEKHLDWAARLLQDANLKLAGGTGLFVDRLPRIWDLPTTDPRPWQPPRAAPFLVNGSLSQEGLQQLQAAIDAGWQSIPLSPAALADEPAALEAAAVTISSSLAKGQPVALHSGLDRPQAQRLAQSAYTLKMPANLLVRQALATIASRVADRLDKLRPNLILSGGECAQAVLDALQISRYRVVGQLLQGLAAIEPDDRQPWASIIAKNGAFGPPDVYERFLNPMASS